MRFPGTAVEPQGGRLSAVSVQGRGEGQRKEAVPMVWDWVVSVSWAEERAMRRGVVRVSFIVDIISSICERS